MENGDWAERIALFRYGVIAPAVNWRLTAAERGGIIRDLAERHWPYPDGDDRRFSRGTLDRWVRVYRMSGLDGLRPQKRSDNGAVRRHPDLFAEAVALRVEVPTRSAAHIADILWERHKMKVSERTIREHLRRRGISREALRADVARVYGRYEAAHSNERWIGDILVDPWVPYPRTATSCRARLFVLVDDYSRLLVHGEFHFAEDARTGQHVLRRAIRKRGLPEQLYVDNGSAYSAGVLARTCAVLGIRLIHSRPYRPEGRGKQERLLRYIRERFLTEAFHVGIPDLDWLNERWTAWAERVCNGRIHSEFGLPPLARWFDGHPSANQRPRAADEEVLADAFRWSQIRVVRKTATVSLEGNSYTVDPALVGRRVELRYDPEDLTRIDVYLEGEPAGFATPAVIRRHVHPATRTDEDKGPAPEATGIDYLGMVADAHHAATIGEIPYRNAIPTQDETEADSPGNTGNTDDNEGPTR